MNLFTETNLSPDIMYPGTTAISSDGKTPYDDFDLVRLKFYSEYKGMTLLIKNKSSPFNLLSPTVSTFGTWVKY
jgi:hypothetical protein